MNKNVTIIAVLVLLCFGMNGISGMGGELFAESKYERPRIYVKVNGMANFSDAGNFGDFIDAKEAFMNQLMESNSWYTITMDKQPFFSGFGGEIGIESRKHAVGISIGYISKTFTINSDYEAKSTGLTEDLTWEFKFSAIPIFLMMHYKVVNTPFLTASFTVGPGVYIVTYRDERTAVYKNGDIQYVNSYLEGNKNILAVHGGVSLDFKITRNLALFIDAGYRLAKLKEMDGESYYENDKTNSSRADAFIYYSTNPTNDNVRFDVGDLGQEPWEAEPAVFHLHGFSLTAGIKITL